VSCEHIGMLQRSCEHINNIILRLRIMILQDTKEAAENDVLPDGSRVKKGSMTGYVPYSMGRMKALWGDDAVEFKPERWLKDGVFQPQPLFKFTAFQVQFCKLYFCSSNVTSYLAKEVGYYTGVLDFQGCCCCSQSLEPDLNFCPCLSVSAC
jgi:hypothetical protein